MMVVNAGVKGTWMFGIAMVFASLLFGDDAEEEFKRGVIETLGPTLGGAVLNGVPGHALGIDLSERVGMPDLWFRSPDKELEGEQEFDYWAIQSLGAGVATLRNIWRGATMALEGNVFRGIETAAPKWIKDLMRAGRYGYEGATTLKGDPMSDPSYLDAIKQALGFTPAGIAEMYDRRNAKYRIQERIEGMRDRIYADLDSAIRSGDAKKLDAVIKRVDEFNAEYPELAITVRGANRSLQQRDRMRQQMDDGAVYNPRLRQRLEDEVAPRVYGK
jgi:hypothetical protein